MLIKTSLITFIVLCICNVGFTSVSPEIENKNVDISIDITSQLVKSTYKITLQHKNNKPISSYTFVLPKRECNKLAFIAARDTSKKELKLSAPKITANDCSYEITVSGTSTIVIETVQAKALEPYPTAITQNEKQLVRFFGNAYFYSPYKTISQKTTVHVGTRSTESFTQVKPSSQSDTSIIYGPYEDIAPNTKSDIVIHYENNSPFLTVTRLERTIEISHWGSISVEETIDIYHSGALLKGSFSRYDYQKDARSGQSSVKNYKTILPAAATNVYYRDTNGNISTSAMRVLKDSVELDLRPRFPLFGGWKTHYTLGYNVPSFEYLFYQGDNYMLKMRLIDHVFDDMVVDEVFVKIILPEGSKNIKLITPYAVDRSPDTLHHTYLDFFGRPVISFRKTNLVENHITDFNLKYTFSKIMMLQEPLLVIIFLFILFVIAIIWMRLDFSIIKEPHQHKD
jgi:oligosaccharyltransferase complex subunit alpha (ribophorin I)